MGAKAKIGAVTPMCMEDERWLPQYLAEVERLQMPFAVHFDKCPMAFRRQVGEHPLCVGWTLNHSGHYCERFRAGPLKQLEANGFNAAVFMDFDETFEPAFGHKLRKLCLDTSWQRARVYWYNIHEKPDTIRIDNPSNPHRLKIFRLNAGVTWDFRGIVVDPYSTPKDVLTASTNLVSFNWGLMNDELRQQHHDRWDRLYAQEAGKNPYSFWQYLIDNLATTASKETVCSGQLEWGPEL